MLRMYFLVTFVALVAFVLSQGIVDRIGFKFSKDLRVVRSRNVLVELIPSQLQSEGHFRYEFGRYIKGDRLLAEETGNTSYKELNGLQLKLTYPKYGIGCIVSYVEIYTNQSSNDASAYVISGGIGLRKITVLVEAKQTLYFGFNASIYGY